MKFIIKNVFVEFEFEVWIQRLKRNGLIGCECNCILHRSYIWEWNHVF